MRTTRILPCILLAGLALFATEGAAAGDTPSPSSSSSSAPGSGESGGAPTEAGTDFRTATAIEQGQQATASGSTGDYLYWVFPADTGQNVTVGATVKLPAATTRHGAATWQIDVYDGLRRRQACRYGSQTGIATAEATSVTLKCHLRTVRSWAEPWDDAPLPGSYFIRLTVLDLPQQDLGLPVQAEVEATSEGSGGSHDVDGKLSAPLVPGAPAAQGEEAASVQPAATTVRPDGGWASSRWSDRWIWTVAGGVLGALAGIAGYALARGRGRTSPMGASALRH